MSTGVRLVILGRQGSGKGTQCTRLSRHYVVPHISTGDYLRAAVREGTELGRMADEFMQFGKLVPDDVIIGIVKERLGQPDAKSRGFILDGFPRTAGQAEALDKMLSEVGMPLDIALDLEVPVGVCLTRLASRRVCRDCGANYSVESPPNYSWSCDACGGEVVQRPDDTEEAIGKRLRDYDEKTEPLIGWYLERDVLAAIDGLGDPDAVTTRLVHAIDHRVR